MPRSRRPPVNVRSRECTAGVPPASSRGVSPRVGTGGETPPELAGEDACDTRTLATAFAIRDVASGIPQLIAEVIG